MNENKDYVSHLNKARKKRNQKCKVGGFRQGSEKK